MVGVLSLKGVHDMCSTTCKSTLSLKGDYGGCAVLKGYRVCVLYLKGGPCRCALFI